jgi:hypothetical protein
MSRVRLSQGSVQAMRLQRLVQEVRALRAALAVADELHDAAALAAAKTADEETVDMLTKVRAKYRVARRKVPT